MALNIPSKSIPTKPTINELIAVDNELIQKLPQQLQSTAQSFISSSNDVRDSKIQGLISSIQKIKENFVNELEKTYHELTESCNQFYSDELKRNGTLILEIKGSFEAYSSHKMEDWENNNKGKWAAIQILCSELRLKGYDKQKITQSKVDYDYDDRCSYGGEEIYLEIDFC